MKLRGRKINVSPVLKLALLVGVVLHLAAFTLFRIDSRPLPDLPARRSFLEYLPSGAGVPAGLEEQAVLMDSAPLFIPTRWSAELDWQAEVAESGDFEFASFEPAIDIAAELGLRRFVPSGGELVSQPEDLLASRFWNLFDDFPFRAQQREPEAEAPSPVARVRSLSRTGNPPLLLPFDADPAGSGEGLPPRFTVRVANGLLVGSAVLVESSGDPAFDQDARAWLESPQTVARLPAGYLEVEVFF